MELITSDGMLRLTDTAIIMEFGPQSIKEKRERGSRIIAFEHILSVDYLAPKTFTDGHLRIITREGQTKVNPVLDTYASRLNKKKDAEKFHAALQGRLAGVVYVTPPPTDEPEQVDRQTSMADFSEMISRNTYFPATFEDLSIDGHLLKQKPSNVFLPPKQWPVAECEAHVETGAAISARVTATRVVAGAYLGGRAGALIGAIAKKDRTMVYLNIVTPDDVILKEVRGLDEGKARKFANKLNNAAAANGASPIGQDAQILAAAASSAAPPLPPPPAGVPAGWYAQGDVQRFWDGKTWTDHTAPLPPS